MVNDDDFSQRIALFRYGVISPLLHFSKGDPQIGKTIEQITLREHNIPGSNRTHIAPGTVRDWVRQYRRGGFDALKRRTRNDRGDSRVLPANIAELLLSAKEKNTALSVRTIINEVAQHPSVPDSLDLPHSTVHRLFKRYGLMDKKPGDATEQDRRRFAYLHAGDMWQSDVMHGPAVVVDAKRKKKTYLIAFIDDATRVIPHAAFALSENTQAFLPVFKQALLQRGLPKRLYVDNGSSYRSTQVALVCAKLNIALIHARPYQPQGKGKIERFFRTLRAQLLTRLTRQDTLSLEALNRRLLVWLQSEYHQTPHHGIDLETPLDRWAQQAGEVRYLEPQVDLDDLFLSEALRKVKSDRTVSLNGLMFEVDAIVVGESVTLRFDPGKPHAPIQVIHEGKFIGIARLVDIHANCHVKRHRPSQNSTPSTQLPASSTGSESTQTREPPSNPLALRELISTDSENSNNNDGGTSCT